MIKQKIKLGTTIEWNREVWSWKSGFATCGTTSHLGTVLVMHTQHPCDCMQWIELTGSTDTHTSPTFDYNSAYSKCSHQTVHIGILLVSKY